MVAVAPGADEREVALCVRRLNDGRPDDVVEEGVVEPSLEGETVWGRGSCCVAGVGGNPACEYAAAWS